MKSLATTSFLCALPLSPTSPSIPPPTVQTHTISSSYSLHFTPTSSHIPLHIHTKPPFHHPPSTLTTQHLSFTLHNANGGFNGGLSKMNSNRNDNRAVSVRADGKGKGLTYKDAGVDINVDSELVRRIAKMAPRIGGFGGLFPLGDSYLVAGTDGVGTKLMLAFETGIHDTIGIDLVAMRVNDIVTSGAKPLFFLDYFATGPTGHLDVDVAEQVIKGIVNGCKQSDCALLGGETAEMPGPYKEGEYDLSGCAVGIVKKENVINGKNIAVGDIIIGLPSSGVYSNGLSLVRRVLAQSGLQLKDKLPGGDITIAEALMSPTTIYVKQVRDVISLERNFFWKGSSFFIDVSLCIYMWQILHSI
ncbi:unnamed protein product [Vicia faba]|uniref:phosphoribosylformylglycinamidine cyclo-ligase n=1 Tax=Vicia faba TaxID=3906 RepID=A0AAV0Z260_VICFA|nr:unnamed protein product [Vicia faba]